MKKIRKIVWCILALSGMIGCSTKESSVVSHVEETEVRLSLSKVKDGEKHDCFVVKDGDSEYNQQYLIDFNRKCSVRYCEVDVRVNDKGVMIADDVTMIHEIGEVSEVIIDSVISDLMPHKAIEYTDEKGKKHIVCIARSEGEDVLVELQYNNMQE